ncbi:hypothetical protein AALP_AA8G046500 [Arabis alpina]|uniref:Uncharacterized protein n=1 Tax=Arabis alpina TaxID=50452 RepID=A0A087G4Z4_ARAAL|nr:hypothetical protein AALP_AA8G046500 [Arabis alpina]
MLRLLRETHKKPDGNYVDARAQSINDEIQRQVRVQSRLADDTPPLDGSGVTGLSQLEEDEFYYKVVKPTQGGRVFGCGGQQSILERGESSNMAAARLTLERQVTVWQEQLASVVEMMRRYMPPNSDTNGDDHRFTTPRRGLSATAPACVQCSDLEESLEAENQFTNDANVELPNQEHPAQANDAAEEDDDATQDPNADY